MTRQIDKLIVHCAATPNSHSFNAATIDQWHRDRGWSGIGYHSVILSSGDIETGRPVGRIGAHAKGYNRTSLGICLIGGAEGGVPVFNFNASQMRSLGLQIDAYEQRFAIEEIIGHRDVSSKACPGFDVALFLDMHLAGCEWTPDDLRLLSETL